MHPYKSTQGSRLTYEILFAAFTVFLLIVMGGILRVAEGGAVCPDWPTCFGQFTPPQGSSGRLDYLHRAWSAVSLAATAWATWSARRRFAGDKWIGRSLKLSLGLFVGQIFVGAIIVFGGLSAGRGISWLHLILSLVILALLVSASSVSFFRTAGFKRVGEFVYNTSFGRLTLFNLLLSAVMLLSGALVSALQAGAACQSWPLCSGLSLPASPQVWLATSHRLLVVASGIGLIWLLRQAWRTQRENTPVLVSTTAAAVLFFSQALLGARLQQGAPVYLYGLHTATAAGFWAALVVQAVCAGLSAASAESERLQAEAFGVRKAGQMARDLLMLTKPVVVALLLVTTFAGMVIGAKQWPSFWLTFWTMLGGFLAAGGSGAINQYIDRNDDQKMQRTQKRPIPAGRLTPGEGLAFGVGMALASFYLVTASVNFTAALLTLAGIVYYVLLYSIFLKKTTVQNIVIGGGAGAIPPLVGWSAATGSLNIPSLFLFAIVFMWTPPHFWALALVRAKDYARAGVPMLPVVRGEQETRRQIFVYTIELVGLTLLLPFFGLGQSIYFTGAAILGLWLLGTAWQVWKQGGNKVAWKMYRYSSMYLAFLFIVLMVDALV